MERRSNRLLPARQPLALRRSLRPPDGTPLVGACRAPPHGESCATTGDGAGYADILGDEDTSY